MCNLLKLLRKFEKCNVMEIWIFLKIILINLGINILNIWKYLNKSYSSRMIKILRSTYLEHGEDSMSAFDSFSLASLTSSKPLVDGGSVVPCTSLDMVEYPSSRFPLSGVSSPSTRSHFVVSSTVREQKKQFNN